MSFAIGAAVVGGVALGGMMGGGSPDYSGMNQSAVESAQLGRDEFDWFKGEYDRTRAGRDRATETDQKVSEQQLASMQMQTALAKDYADYNKTTFRPLEQKMVADATGYDTPERRAAAATEAVADVNSQVASQRAASAMDLARSGVAPDSMRAQALTASGDINATKLAAGAAYGARRGVEATGYARMADAVNLGRNLPSAQATAVQTGTQAGTAATSAAGAGLQADMSGAGLMQTGFAGAMQGVGQAGRIFGDIAGNQVTTRGQDLAATSSMFGSFMKSDPAVKKNRKVVEPSASMAGLRKTDIENWQYDPTKGGPDDGGAVRTGPMADAANENLGDDVAPNGELLNVASMMGVVANAVKDVDKRLAKLEQRKAA